MKKAILAVSVLLAGAFTTPVFAFVYENASRCVSPEGLSNNGHNVVFYNSCSTKVRIYLRPVNDDGSDYSIGCAPGRCSVTVHRSRAERFGTTPQLSFPHASHPELSGSSLPQKTAGASCA